jgi:alkylation response protein AidB-like acyl-CoA dehydrogenase
MALSFLQQMATKQIYLFLSHLLIREKKTRGVSAFIVEKDMPGYRIGN